MDLKLGCSSSLAAYKLFDYLLAGNFHASNGTYTVAMDSAETPSGGTSPRQSAPSLLPPTQSLDSSLAGVVLGTPG